MNQGARDADTESARVAAASMRQDCECRIPDYHGDDDWVPVADVHGTADAVLLFARRMDAKDFELFPKEDESHEVWVRKVGVQNHMVYRVSFQIVKQFLCEIA